MAHYFLITKKYYKVVAVEGVSSSEEARRKIESAYDNHEISMGSDEVYLNLKNDRECDIVEAEWLSEELAGELHLQVIK